VKQWTGVEQKAIVRILIPVITPLLLRARAPTAIQCARAVVDFVLLAQYYTHDDDTLVYMEHALYRLDKYVNIFREYRPLDKDTEEGHFNFSKYHAMSHYPRLIKRYGSAVGVDTSHSEHCHSFLVKQAYKRTNKREGFEKQIILYNTRHLNMTAMQDALLYQHTRLRPQAEEDMTIRLTQVSRPVALSSLGWPTKKAPTPHRRGRLPPERWSRAIKVEERLGISGLLDVLAVFVRENRARGDGVAYADERIEHREADPSWVGDYLIAISTSIHCWKRDGKTADLQDESSEFVRCSPA